MTSTPHDAHPLETQLEEQPAGRATLLGDDPAGHDELVIEHLEDRVLMSSDAAAALAPPETAAPAPVAYVGSQQPGDQTTGGPPASSGGSVIEARVPLAEVVDAAADATAAIAHGEGESRGAAGGTPGNPQAPSRNEPKEPVELTETKTEPPEKVEPPVEHGEKHEPRDPRAEREGDDSVDTHGNARTRSVASGAADVVRADQRSEVNLASDEAHTARTNSASSIDPDIGEGAVETKLEVVAEVDLASLRHSQSNAVLPDEAEGEHASAEHVNSPVAQGINAPESQSSAEAVPATLERAEVPQAHDAVFERVASQGVADAVEAGAPLLGDDRASVQGAAGSLSR